MNDEKENCPNCMKLVPSVEPHTCPYAEELDGCEDTCKCCEKCTENCANDI